MNELDPLSESVNPVPEAGIDASVVNPEVYALAFEGVEVAEALAQTEPFDYFRADLSLRNMAGLFNGFDPEDATLTHLDATDVQRARDLAVRSYEVLGEKAKQDARKNMDAYRPVTAEEAEETMLRHSFNAFQVAVGMGPDRGYDRSQEAAIRDLVKDYAKTFAGIYCGLSAIDHPLTTSPSQRGYFANNVRFATPRSYEDAVEMDDNALTVTPKHKELTDGHDDHLWL